jgi:hypothetical protein
MAAITTIRGMDLSEILSPLLRPRWDPGQTDRSIDRKPKPIER